MPINRDSPREEIINAWIDRLRDPKSRQTIGLLYRSAVNWLALNDDNSDIEAWSGRIGDELPQSTIACSLVADIFGYPDIKVMRDVKKKLKELFP